ncbi:MAG TPA: hypothetical protein VEU55_01865 [Gemmatimonadales bacterium]|nr:hypothetical protein [Gemmatimonadales bacterium]
MKPFRYRELPQLPRLAWLAVMNRDAGDLLVYHGSALECRDHWMVEGTWDGEFTLGGFHESEHFFGSGIRTAEGGDAVHFVPSSALVNGLYYCERRRELVVSNSLILLLAFTGARLDPDHDYHAETYAFRQGAARYARDFPVSHREIKAFYQVYDLSLVASARGDDPLEFASVRPAPNVPSYVRYRELVDTALRRLRANYTSPDRRAPLGAFATISSGYDSAAVAVLVKDLGVESYFTCRRSNTHAPQWISRRAAVDDGTPIARGLGLTATPLDTRGSQVTEDELYFLAPGCAPPNLALHGLARHIERRRPAVLFTGFLGDEVWDRNPWERRYQDEGIVRGDTTALMLSEIRLKSGFINVAVPALCARRVQDLAVLSESTEMAPWRLGTRDYDRPIPRRILEEAGIPRDLFAGRKKAVVGTYTWPRNRALRPSYFAAVRARYGRRAGFVYLHRAANRFAWWWFRAYHLLRRRLWGIEPPDTPPVLIGRQFDFAYLQFLWAARTLSERFAALLKASGVVPVPLERRRRTPPRTLPPGSPPVPRSRAASADPAR